MRRRLWDERDAFHPGCLSFTSSGQFLAQRPTPGLVRITYDMYGIPDRLDCFYKGVLVASTDGLVSGTGTLQWAYAPAPGDPTWRMVRVSAPNSGTGDSVGLRHQLPDLSIQHTSLDDALQSVLSHARKR
jgi:hypothetical protein